MLFVSSRSASPRIIKFLIKVPKFVIVITVLRAYNDRTVCCIPFSIQRNRKNTLLNYLIANAERRRQLHMLRYVRVIKCNVCCEILSQIALNKITLSSNSNDLNSRSQTGYLLLTLSNGFLPTVMVPQ